MAHELVGKRSRASPIPPNCRDFRAFRRSAPIPRGAGVRARTAGGVALGLTVGLFGRPSGVACEAPSRHALCHRGAGRRTLPLRRSAPGRTMLHHPRFVAAFFSALLLGALPAHAQDAAAQGAPAQDAPAQEGPAQDAPTPEETARAAETAEPATRPGGPSSEEEVRAQLAALAEPGGLTADQAAARAVETAPSVRRAEASVRVAEAAARQAWQGFFPQFEASFRYTRLSDIDQPDFGGFEIGDPAVLEGATEAVDDPDARFLWQQLISGLSSTSESFQFPVILNQYAFRATVTYPVSNVLFTILPGYRASETAAEAQRAQIRGEQRQVALRAREAFYELARARGTLVVAEKAVEQVEAHQRQVQALVDAGAAARVDLLRVQAQLAQANVNAARARGGVALATRALQVLLHEEPSGSLRLGEDFSQTVPPPSESLPELTARALDQRPEIVAMQQVEEARERAIQADLGRRYPQLALQANLDYANPNNRFIPQQEEFNASWDISVLLRWSPNEFGDARQRVETARAQLLEVQADMARLEDAVRLEGAQAFEELRSAQLAFEASKVGLHAAEESYRVRFDQLQAGAAVTSDVIDAEAELTRARLEVVDAAIGVRLARDRLDASVGE
ncbi:MAG: hypothetical protein CMN29_06760 [Sandaracinus sp.]|nr:hypothetical protein [Sandaracinus sp.]